jgi:CHAD domain-containing protein
MLRDDLRWLRRAAAQVRDYDVLLERALPSSFVEWLTVERAEARDHLLAALNSARCPSLLGALAPLEPIDEREITKQVEVERRKVVRRGRALERAAATTEQAHRLRRAVRRMRYAREWLGEKPRELKSLQDELGRLNDAASALAHLDQCPHAAQLAQLRGEIAAELQRAFDDAREAWRETDVETA